VAYDAGCLVGCGNCQGYYYSSGHESPNLKTQPTFDTDGVLGNDFNGALNPVLAAGCDRATPGTLVEPGLSVLQPEHYDGMEEGDFSTLPEIPDSLCKDPYLLTFDGSGYVDCGAGYRCVAQVIAGEPGDLMNYRGGCLQPDGTISYSDCSNNGVNAYGENGDPIGRVIGEVCIGGAPPPP